jgi:hypothetical protein
VGITREAVAQREKALLVGRGGDSLLTTDVKHDWLIARGSKLTSKFRSNRGEAGEKPTTPEFSAARVKLVKQRRRRASMLGILAYILIAVNRIGAFQLRTDEE